MQTEMDMPTLTPQQILRKRKAGEPLLPGEPEQVHRHTIAVLLENTIGALIRVVNLFSARGFNLESVTVGETDDPTISRMTIVTTGNDRIIGQVLRQLDRLIDTLHVEDLTGSSFVERELCLLKVRYTNETRAAIMDTAEIFRGKVVDITPDTMTFELTGPTSKIEAFIKLMKPHGILEVARSGRVAMRRSSGSWLTHEDPTLNLSPER
ncbi:acetolactate synthase small subunit [Rhodothermus marinus]|uniref:acetolactate synthase small subunit n=2 Tax=Rhodothermus marinus TaxID=29549 RepID=UPI0012BA4002|nr:acetolactate synthase small subunit [Rhodothermus marinus]BBM68922.1 acetolactate synthase small subunit [Rhodothermus marinus]BBM71900.1 acetolactate synthase small subunit [Rhodothermus marinus]